MFFFFFFFANLTVKLSKIAVHPANVQPENSRISFLFSFLAFFSVGHTSSRRFQWRKIQSAICLRQVRAGLGLGLF